MKPKLWAWSSEQVVPAICKMEILLESWTIERLVTSKHRALSMA